MPVPTPVSYEAAVAADENIRPLFPAYDLPPAEREALDVFLTRYLALIPAHQRDLLRAVAIERMPLVDIVAEGGVRGYRGVNPRAMTQHIRSARRAFLWAAAQDDPAGPPPGNLHGGGEDLLVEAAARTLAAVREEVTRRPTTPG